MPPINTNNASTSYTKVTSSATVVDLVAENGRRVALMIYNKSTAALYIRIDANATLTDFTLIIPSESYYEMPIGYYTDKITGIWVAANGYATVTEISK